MHLSNHTPNAIKDYKHRQQHEFNTTVDELVRLNNIKDKNVIYVGQKLIVREKTTQPTPPKEEPKAPEQPTKPEEPLLNNRTSNLVAFNYRYLGIYWASTNK